MVNVNALLINSDSPIMKCCTKERNTSTSPWCHSTWGESRFEFSTPCSLCLPSSVCLFQESETTFPVPYACVYLSIVGLCVPVHYGTVCVCLYICVHVCLSIFIEQHRKHHTGKEWDTLTRLYKGLSHWLQWIPTDSGNKQNYKHHCLSSNF